MLLLFRSLVWSSVLLLIVVATALVLSIETSPKIPLEWHSDAQLAKELFQKTAAYAQRNQSLMLNEPELNHAINSVVNRYIPSSTQIRFSSTNSAVVDVALQLPRKLSDYYINLHFNLVNTKSALWINQLTIGKISITDTLANQLISAYLRHSVLKQYYALATQHIKTIKIYDKQLIISYAFNAMAKPEQGIKGDSEANSSDLAGKNQTGHSTSAESLAIYQQQLNAIVNQHDPSQRLSLAALLGPLFKYAADHGSELTAINDNIAIIYVVSAYVNNNEIPFYIPINKLVLQTKIYPVFLYKRTDQAKHFMLSAALTITGGAYLSDILGQEKELRDAQSPSGFSFIDLAADRAGMKFSERAIASVHAAKKLQQNMAEITDYQAFMPATQDLPEKMNNAQFTQQFDSISSKRYRQLLQIIDDKIEALPIYH